MGNRWMERIHAVCNRAGKPQSGPRPLPIESSRLPQPLSKLGISQKSGRSAFGEIPIRQGRRRLHVRKIRKYRDARMNHVRMWKMEVDKPMRYAKIIPRR